MSVADRFTWLFGLQSLTELKACSPLELYHCEIICNKKIYQDFHFQSGQGMPDFQEIFSQLIHYMYCKASKKYHVLAIFQNIISPNDCCSVNAHLNSGCTPPRTCSSLKIHFSVTKYCTDMNLFAKQIFVLNDRKQQKTFLKVLNNKFFGVKKNCERDNGFLF